MAEVVHTPAQSGNSVWVVGDRYTTLIDGARTGGAYAMIEAWVPPGGGPPPHIHSREDEGFHVLEGTVRFHADGKTFLGNPGDWVHLPKGSLHRFENVGTAPARMLVMVVPAGLEQMFAEVGAPAPHGSTAPAPTPEMFKTLIETSARYGIEIRPPH